MTEMKSDEELLYSNCELTEDELDRKLQLIRLLQYGGSYEPFQLDEIDVENCMKEWGLIPDEFTNVHPTKEDEDILFMGQQIKQIVSHSGTPQLTIMFLSEDHNKKYLMV